MQQWSGSDSQSTCINNQMMSMRSLDNLYLLHFVELPLKGTSGFQKALDSLLETTMADYMEQYFVLIPGDWLAQFFMPKLSIIQ